MSSLLTLVVVFVCDHTPGYTNMAGCVAKSSTRRWNEALATELSWVYSAVVNLSAFNQVS